MKLFILTRTGTLPKVMYYSIDKVFNMCGQCCMDPKYYSLFHIFESNLTLADSDVACPERNYPLRFFMFFLGPSFDGSMCRFYKSTVTHGAWPLSMTLDLYTQKP